LSEIFSIKLKISDPLKECSEQLWDGGAKTDSGARIVSERTELELPNQGGGMPDLIQTEESYAGGSPGLYAPGGKFFRGMAV
jgi:hypothetical protein